MYHKNTQSGATIPPAALFGDFNPAGDVGTGAQHMVAPSRVKHDQALYNQAWHELEQKRYDQAISLFNRVLQLNPDNADALSNMGFCLYSSGRLDLALKTYKLALHLAPGEPSIMRGIANCLESQGHFDEATTLYEDMLAADSNNAQWLYNLVLIGDYTPDSAVAQRLRVLHQSPRIADEARILIAFALAKIEEAAGRHRLAFAYYEKGNRITFANAPYHESQFFHYLDLMQSAFDSELFETFKEVGNTEVSPIFVMGMPRSGTSLVEQILASHPLVHGAGELSVMPDIMTTLLRQLTGSIDPHGVRMLNVDAFKALAQHYLNVAHSHSDKTYIVDKMPNNIFYIGMIKLLFPNAKIIHCVRDAMDTCWSLYRQHFNSAHYYCYDQQSLGRFFVRYQQLMRHWHAMLPDAIYDIEYETLVEKPQPTIAALLEQCGLTWDDACLNFHATKRAVSTASMRQVRQPIYQSSLQSWKPVAHELAPLREILGY